MSRHKELAKNTTVLFMGKFFTQFLSFFLLPLYTRFLPTSDYGTVDLLMTYISLISPIVTIQQEMATFRYLVDARGDNKKLSKIIQTSIKNVLFRVLCFSIIYLLVAVFIDSKYKYLILIAGVSASFSNLFLQIARGLGKNTKYAIGASIAGVITLISNVVMICFMHFGGESLLISMAIANIICIIYEFFALEIFRYLGKNSVDKVLRKSMLKYSWPLVPNGISWWLINASDRTIISTFIGVSANGIYAVANKFPSIISGFLNIFSMSWAESASLHINDGDKDDFFSSVANNILKLFSSLCLAIISGLPFIFNIIVGEDYIEAYKYIPIALIATMFSCIVNVYSAIYIAKKLTKKVAMTSIVSATINIIIDLVLINFIGLYAAVLSTTIAYAVMAVYRHFDVKKYVDIKYKNSDILLAIIGFIVVITLYYINNPVLNIINVIITIIYALFQTRNISIKTLKKFKR